MAKKLPEDVTDMVAGVAGIEKGIANMNTILLEQKKTSIDCVEHLLEKCQFSSDNITGTLAMFADDPDGTPLDTAAVYDRKSQKTLKLAKGKSKIHIVNQQQAFSILQPTFEQYAMDLVTHGTQRGIDWACLSVPELEQGNAEEDKQKMYLVATLNGGLQMKVCWSPIRVACSNTLNMAFAKARNTFSVPAQKFLYQEAAVKVIGKQIADPGIYIDAQALYIDMLKTRKVTEDRITDYIEYMMPASLPERFEPEKRKQLELRRENFRKCFDDESAEEYRNTAYGLIMAASYHRSRMPLNRIGEGSVISYVQQRLASPDAFLNKTMKYCHYCT